MTTEKKRVPLLERDKLVVMQSMEKEFDSLEKKWKACLTCPEEWRTKDVQVAVNRINAIARKISQGKKDFDDGNLKPKQVPSPEQDKKAS